MRMKLLFLLACLALLTCNCTQRRIIIATEPPGAAVTVDGEDKGLTPTSFQFSFYGGREIVLEKEGYQTYKSIIPVNAPVFQIFPLDLMMLLVPYPFIDTRTFYFILEKQGKTDIKKCIERMEKLKEHLEEELRNEPHHQPAKK